jgi:hypothetical protein
MNQVTVEYVDECLGKSGSLRRVAAKVVLPHTYSKSYGNPLLRCQQLVVAVHRHSVAGVRPGGLHLDRLTAATHVVTGAGRTDPEPDPGNLTGVHRIGDDEQLAEDLGQLVAPARAGGGNEELTPALQDRLHRPNCGLVGCGQPLDNRDEVVEDLGH